MEQLKLPAELVGDLAGPQTRRARSIQASGEIARLKAMGYGPVAIARTLNQAGVSTPSGRGVWWHTTVLRHSDPRQRAAWNRYMNDYRRRHM